jgi:hypothetical protein
LLPTRTRAAGAKSFSSALVRLGERDASGDNLRIAS